MCLLTRRSGRQTVLPGPVTSDGPKTTPGLRIRSVPRRSHNKLSVPHNLERCSKGKQREVPQFLRLMFGKINPNLSERAEGLLSYWNNFTSKATINNFAFAKEFIKTKGLHEGQAQIRGKQIGFDNKIMMSEFLLKQKNV